MNDDKTRMQDIELQDVTYDEMIDIIVLPQQGGFVISIEGKENGLYDEESSIWTFISDIMRS